MSTVLLALALAQPTSPPAALFAPVAEVLLHPRCLNCHPTGEAPLQTDASRPHRQNVSRALERLGAGCVTCHVAGGPDGPGMPPPVAEWRLPPRQAPMVFQDRTPGQLCEQLKDRDHNGGLTLPALRTHLAEDVRVRWGFAPGAGRTKPPLSHPEFLARVDAWLAAGAPCPPGGAR